LLTICQSAFARRLRYFDPREGDQRIADAAHTVSIETGRASLTEHFMPEAGTAASGHCYPVAFAGDLVTLIR
jgi:hypothetical protein